MEKQIIEISNNDFYLSLYRGFLTLENKETGIKNQIPLDNILSLILSGENITITKNIINAICENGGTIICCNKSYIPNSITLPYTGHWLISKRIKQQLECSIPLQKKLWQNIVQHKILNQAKILESIFPQHPNIERLKNLSKKTLSGDTQNCEGIAASVYFKSLFGDTFIRDRAGGNANILLNYTYTVLRAIVARAVAGNGLLPYIGIKHCNKTNPLPLVDDLIEPFRPIADKLVFEQVMTLPKEENIILSPDIKRKLVDIITYPVQTDKGLISLNNAIYDFISSLSISYEMKKVLLKYPDITYCHKF